MSEYMNTRTGIFTQKMITIGIAIILITSILIPAFLWMNVYINPPQTTPVAPPEGELITPEPVIMPTVAGEPNFTRDSFPFVLNNYPDFHWKNPGQFDSGVHDGVGYNPSLPIGTGAELYPEIYAALEGLDETYIRIAYMDANYEWQLVPFQIDQIGWPNVWQVADLNQWAGMNIYSQPDRSGADAIAGMGWLSGDPADSLGNSDGNSENNLWVDWYRVPIHTYVTRYQPDGSFTSESVSIDTEYAQDLVDCYMGNPGAPHGSYTQADGYWQFYGSGNEAFVGTTGGTPTYSNMIFMGDTWYITPDNTSGIAWVNSAFNYKQIDGYLDKDDEICFYAYPGRQAPTWMWWNYSHFPNRFELEITDPVDGGKCWMYIYYTRSAPQGAPSYTTEYSDYVSWDPQTMTVTSDFYQVSMDENNPTLLDNARLFGETDGQPLLDSFNKMYGFGEASAAGIITIQISAGRDGIWYSWSDGSSHVYSELYCTLDNPSIKYPTVADDTSDPDRTAVTSPQHYYGPRGSVTGHTYGRNAPQTGSTASPIGPSMNDWELKGDKRAVIDGPCRVIFYLQQYLALGVFIDETVVTVDVYMDVDVFTALLDGPSFYYRRMQLSPPATTAMPEITGIDVSIYYIYIMCGNFQPATRADFKMTSATEWSGGPDGTNQGVPSFDFSNGMGWQKLGDTTNPIDPQITTWIFDGESVPDGGGGAGVDGDLYYSRGDPMLDDDVTNAKAHTSNTLPDWVMLTSETHGGMWVYFPRREVMEIRDNSPPSPAADILMYWRDDSYQSEFGICINGPIYGGSTTSPYAYMMVYGDFKHGDVAQGHKLYLQYYYPLTGITDFTPQTPAPQFLYDTVQPDKLIYQTGETVTITITGTPDGGGGATTDITGDFTEIGGGGAVVATDIGTEKWSVSQVITGGSGYDRTITFSAVHDPDGPGGSAPWPASDYDMDITVDDVPPDNPAVLDPLTSPTTEAAVLLDWTANPGNDTGSASMANPSGLSHYRLRRGTSSGGPYNTIVADNIPITTTQFLDTFVVNLATYYYKLDTYDVAGNMASMSGEESTTIQLPFLPAQPADLPATINPSGGITVDWTANPGAPGITSYQLTRSGALYLDDALAGTYTNVGSATTSTSVTDPGPFTEAYHYCYKVVSTFGGTATSAPVHTRVDTVAPAPAELATPFDPYQSEGLEIVVSWAIETIPQYSSGGFPGQDLNGIAYWEIWRQHNPPSTWTLIATVPYGPTTQDQQYLDTNVIDNDEYEYSIRTYDGAGNWAENEYTKTTTLQVVGQGIAAIDAVTASATEVTQGDSSVPITVDFRNPGVDDVTLTDIQLYFYDGLVDVTGEYTGASVTGLSQSITAYGGTWSTVINVDVDPSATLGTIDMYAEATYNVQSGPTGLTTTGGADSWLVKPDADLNVQSVTSTVTIVHPGEEAIPVTVSIKNPGSTTATLDSVQLVFTRGVTDISDKFMVEYVSTVPTTLTDETKAIQLQVTVSQGITTGAVTIDATCAGSAQGVPLGDTDGGISTWDWGVQTYPKPVIVSAEADKAVYWDGDTITLTVVCDTGLHTVKAWFGNLGAPTNVSASSVIGTTYTIQHTQSGAPGEGTYNVIIYAENGTPVQTDTYILPVRLGQAPTFSGWSQTPGVGSVGASDSVDVDIDIDDAQTGQDSVTAVLRYRVDGGAWSNNPMTYAGSGHWDATIPAQPGDSLVEYHINASDPQGNWDVDSHSYTVGGVDTDPVVADGTAHQPGNPGVVYDISNPSPRGNVEYSVDIDTQYMTVAEAGTYVVLVSIFSPSYSCWIDIDASVYLDNTMGVVSVTLALDYAGATFPAGAIVTGRAYVLTDLPSNFGRTVSMFNIQHQVT